MGRGPVPRPLLQRLLEQTEIVEGPLDSPCWIFTGYRDRWGYGKIRDGSRVREVHVVSWGHYREALPAGSVRHHRCETPACWNPDHLAALSHREHAVHHHGSGYRCGAGHFLDSEGVYWNAGRPVCRKCTARHQRAYDQRQRVRGGAT